jgi:NAD(P)H-dependent flavin oxidoreductase YrpB (nitropropane dioxygenase family)
MVGQSIGLIKEVLTCKELIESMVEEARTIFANNLARF